MIAHSELEKIRNELQKYFPEASSISNEGEVKEGPNYYQTFYLYLNKSKKIVLKFSEDYLNQQSFEDFSKHLHRNIYYIMKSNINKSICLLKNFEIEVEEHSPA